MLVRKTQSLFQRFAKGTSHVAGRPLVFSLAVAVILLWAAAGPVFGYSESWQLTINTTTTIVTFLMVFLIQATQNRDAEAIQIKLDELVLSVKGAHDEIIDSEDMDEAELLRLHEHYQRLAERARQRHESRAAGDRGRKKRNNGRRGSAAPSRT